MIRLCGVLARGQGSEVENAMRLFHWVDADGVWRCGRADQVPGDVHWAQPWERFDDQVVEADAEVRQLELEIVDV